MHYMQLELQLNLKHKIYFPTVNIFKYNLYNSQIIMRYVENIVKKNKDIT